MLRDRNRQRAVLFGLLVFLVQPVACSGHPETHSDLDVRSEAIVYGEDDRVDPYETIEPFTSLARNAAVAIIHPDHLPPNADGTYAVDAPTLGENFSLCAGERFANQPAAANCSGVLVAADVVATSAHCVVAGLGGRPECSDSHFVFGYVIDGSGAIEVRGNHVYHCAEVLARIASTEESECRFDLALVRLDRAVEPPLAAVPIRREPVSPGEDLAVIGFPAGLPAKVDLGAHVIDARLEQGDYFTLNSDTFAVSSGSGVFDVHGELVGLFARGRRDFDEVGGCSRVHRESDDATAGYEEASHVTTLPSLLAAARDGAFAYDCDASPPCELATCIARNPDAADGGATGMQSPSCSATLSGTWRSRRALSLLLAFGLVILRMRWRPTVN